MTPASTPSSISSPVTLATGGGIRRWTYWAALVLLGMTGITAVSTYFITFFDTFGIDLTHWKWLIELCFLVSLVSINLIAVKGVRRGGILVLDDQDHADLRDDRHRRGQ